MSCVQCWFVLAELSLEQTIKRNVQIRIFTSDDKLCNLLLVIPRSVSAIQVDILSGFISDSAGFKLSYL